jgi:SAM-dependent methyltransferase
MHPFQTRLPLRRVEPDPVTERVETAYVERFGADPANRGGWYRPDDWARISFVLGALRPGGSILDVGVGAGQFVNALALSGRFDRVVGTDPTLFGKYFEMDETIERHSHGVEDLPYGDDAFDVVTCMEVLEHLPGEIFEPALAELRRVCRGQLIMTVPFEEPEPIYEGHRRRFETDDVLTLFPEANRILLDRGALAWALLEEWPSDRWGAAAHHEVRLAAVEAALRGPRWRAGRVRIRAGRSVAPVPQGSRLARLGRSLPEPIKAIVRPVSRAVRSLASRPRKR